MTDTTITLEPIDLNQISLRGRRAAQEGTVPVPAQTQGGET